MELITSVHFLCRSLQRTLLSGTIHSVSLEGDSMKTRTVLWLVLGIPTLFLVGPWVWVGVPDELARQRADRWQPPQTLATAVCDRYATEGVISEFLARGDDVNQRVPGNYGASVPLIAHAAECGRADHVRQLLSRGAHVANVELSKVLADEDYESDAVARVLIAGGADLRPHASSSVETVDAQMPDLLQVAADTRRAWLVPILVAHGHDVQIVDKQGEGLLAVALRKYPQSSEERSDTLKTLKALLAAGAHVNPRSKQELPPLYVAAKDEKLDAVELLLQAGAEPDAPAPPHAFIGQGALPDAHVTALSIAVSLCRDAVVKTLLSHAASKDVVTPNGQSLNDGACSRYGYGDPMAVRKIRTLLAG